MNKKEIQTQLAYLWFYKQFPAMIPFIGDYYSSSKHKKLLLIGESYYLPNETVLHHSATNWYKSNQSQLNDEEVEWINCNGLLTCDWQSAGHQIYREINSCIFSLGIKSDKRAIDEVSYTNYFQRPAEKEGESFKYFCTEEDIQKSHEILTAVINIMNPEIIIFVSKYSWDIGGSKIRNTYSNKVVDFVCHPGTGGRYWHNVEYPNNKMKFMKLLKENFI